MYVLVLKSLPEGIAVTIARDGTVIETLDVPAGRRAGVQVLEAVAKLLDTVGIDMQQISQIITREETDSRGSLARTVTVTAETLKIAQGRPKRVPAGRSST